LGCGIKLTTINYVNLSNDVIWVDIEGVYPDSSPGVLLPGTGTEQLKRKSGKYVDPVNFHDDIKITWNVEGETTKKTVELKREDYGIPAKIQGGEIKIIYTASGEWEMKYYRSPVKWKE
jgi:hypothetical protein